ncbi:MAG: hypothetical protein N2Z62_04190 [Rhodobacteraceae bacterium]|nr:hypothetical protein [Paracoccaceae bacterium]
MIAFARLVVVLFVVQTVFYVLIRLYVRSLRREKLEKRWEREGAQGDRDAYVEAGMREFDASLTPKLLLLVYVIPAVVIGVILYATSFR